MTEQIEKTSVLVSGGGPVGLMTALELNHHGIETILVERNPSTTRHPKMDITNGRSMELFRRLGVVDALRAGAVPEDHPYSVIWVDSLLGSELARFDYPSVNDRRQELRQINDGSLAGEPSMRISQVHLEPILKKHIEEHCDHVDLRFGWALESLEQDADGVNAVIRNPETGETRTVRADYLAGCDGAGSRARRELGIHINTITPEDFLVNGSDTTNLLDSAKGEPPADAPKNPLMYMVHFSSPDSELLDRFGKAWHLQTLHGWGMIAQNDIDVWTIHFFAEHIADYETKDPKAILFEVLGCEFECEIHVANAWRPNLGLADSYGQGRVWLAGDSVHQVIPTGGYGMNSGMGDATALAWVLAANIKGWGGPKLLEAYELERRHVGARVRIASARHAAIRFLIGQQYDPVIHEDSEAGQQKRDQAGSYILEAGNLENEAWGIEWGYRYDNSPVICHETGEAPAYEWHYVVPTTWPSVRAPNVFLDEGAGDPIFDRFGKEFTLLNFGSVATEGFAELAAELGIPLDIVNIDDTHAATIYEKSLVLVRPDQHVAWRGDSAPDNTELKAIFNKVTGR